MSDTLTLPEARAKARSAPQPTVHLPDDIESYLGDDQWSVFGPAIRALRALDMPFAIGGGLATSLYSGMWRCSKDIDVYVQPAQRDRAISAVLGAGLTDYHDEKPYDRSWLFRGVRNGVIVDVMWALANGAGEVERDWLTRGPTTTLRGEAVRVLAPDDIFWSKVHVLQRDRSDWPDLLNLLYSNGPAFDWTRLLRRMESSVRLLASVLSLFAWIAPGRAGDLPSWLWSRVQLPPPADSRRLSERNVRLLDTRDWFTHIEP